MTDVFTCNSQSTNKGNNRSDRTDLAQQRIVWEQRWKVKRMFRVWQEISDVFKDETATVWLSAVAC